MREKLLELLAKYTTEQGPVPLECFTASYLANELSLSRNSISQYLNEFIQENKVVKVNSRPVYFFEIGALEKRGIELENSVFETFDDLTMKKEDFDRLIGYRGSLSHAIEQCKAAMCYPPMGLPILLNGATGTGKSRIAQTMFEYAQECKHILPKESKFVVINCSEYANNPELLTANLFGHKKGAYTGADKDNPGLIQLADGGVLFLDEVHCLKAECQEKLFLFMDKGVYHRVGDNENWFHSDVRLVFATTENPEDVLLKTLLRRIPIIVKIPSLEERPRNEKAALLALIFKEESKEIGKTIEISSLAYQIFMDTSIPGNVGGLVNSVKATCANAFLNNNLNDEILEIHVYNLPEYVLQLAPVINFRLQDAKDKKMMKLSFPYQANPYDAKLIAVYGKMLESYRRYLENPLTNKLLNDNLQQVIDQYSDYLMYDRAQASSPNIEFTKKITDKIFSIVMNRYSLKISNNDILLISRYLSEYARLSHEFKNWINNHLQEINDFSEVLQMKFPREYAIVTEIVDNIGINLDIEIDEMMKIRLMLVICDLEKNESANKTVAVILCHGYSTASSIADAVNKMLNENIFDAIDMQLDMSVDKITNQLNDYLKMKNYFDDLVLLVDMGSLEEIYKGIKRIPNVNVSIINNINTKLALSIGSKIKQGADLSKSLESACKDNVSQFKYIQNRAKKKAILSVCATGVGAAEKILDLFKKSLPVPIDAEILTYDYNKLVENGKEDYIFERYDISFIIGTMNPYIDEVPFIAIEDLVLNSDMNELKKVTREFCNDDEFDILKQNIIKNFTLNNIVNHLTILNAEKVLDDVEYLVEQMEEHLSKPLLPASKVGLYVHLSCLIERLILKNEVQLIEDPVDFIEQHEDFINLVREIFSVVELNYSVEIPVSEIIYIFNYIENYL
ncbi:sigma 54-interacting transcriptional regulator [Anaerorhabdus sp.]|uniref:sigma 54-interacting transcriptional regulator n=1 Tax=Anaerorhabdus sp. TaxID=1872524 RepID=UPI002B203D00|nr:sigma 54-interacting transcriptional regulator [Anaerorhabdus sp.]MEA4875432.1 sigma 54-interacting transcriptional regulator [Anaerorhabdus sp.]